MRSGLGKLKEMATYVTVRHPEQRLNASSASLSGFVSHWDQLQYHFSSSPVLSLSPFSTSSCKPNPVAKARHVNIDCQRGAASFVISSSDFCFFLFVRPGSFMSSENAVLVMNTSSLSRVGINSGAKCLRMTDISSGVLCTRHVPSRHCTIWMIILNTRNQAAGMGTSISIFYCEALADAELFYVQSCESFLGAQRRSASVARERNSQ